jgi:hypothetical protein
MLLIITLVLLPRAQSVEYLSHIIWLNRWQGAGIVPEGGTYHKHSFLMNIVPARIFCVFSTAT